MTIDDLLGLKSSLALGIFFCKRKCTWRQVSKNPLSEIFRIINELTSNHQFPNIHKAFLCILPFYPKNIIATNRGATKYQYTDKGYGMQPGPDNNQGGSTGSVSSANSLAFLLYSSFFSWTPKRVFQALIALPKPKYQQYQDIDSLSPC